MSAVEPGNCRLCGGTTRRSFATTVLAKYEVSYQCCQECGSLQSEQPYWLAEAYADAACSIDPGSARRTLDSCALIDIVARLFRCRSMLDFGGNTGLLCRLLRDRGYAAYSFDRHVTATYAPQFVGSPADHYDLVSAFEVIEHFERPAQDLEQIFGTRPRIVVVTTELFAGQTDGWWYLAPREGQHIFLYSERAIRWIAARYAYEVLIGKGFLLFSRDPLTAPQKLLLARVLRPRVLRTLGAILLMRRTGGAERDYAALTSADPKERVS